MREILFKAKRKDNGEWVEGYFVKLLKDMCYIIDKDTFSHYLVDENTLCQYTGLTDKNGNKIWENDLLDCQDRIVIVKWHEQCGTWDSYFVKYKNERCSNGIQVTEWKYRAKVIGNIFDNPELMNTTETIGYADNGGLMSAT